MCGSHSGTDDHTTTAAGLLRRVGLSENDLLCGAHRPFDIPTGSRMDAAGQEPTAIHNNCSGKHSGMLAHVQHLRAGGLKDDIPYIDPAHPIQQANLAALADLAGTEAAEIGIAVDGCSAPTYALPLRNTARAFARFMALAGAESQTKRAEACRAVVAAMTAHPTMVAGPGRFDTDLIRAGQGKWIAKVGAEGLEAVGIAPGVLGPASPALGVAVKILDGDPFGRAVKVVVIEALRQLGVLDESALAALTVHAAGPMRNWRGAVVGEARVCFELEIRD